MPLTHDEIVKLPREVLVLLEEIHQTRSDESDGGVKITKAERKRLAVLAGKLLLALTLDTLD
jgi:hypothetical protein